VYDGEQRNLHIRLDTPAWFTWLGASATHSFSYPVYDAAHGYIDGFIGNFATMGSEYCYIGGIYCH
jgi:hypothetical protein